MLKSSCYDFAVGLSRMLLQASGAVHHSTKDQSQHLNVLYQDTFTDHLHKLLIINHMSASSNFVI